MQPVGFPYNYSLREHLRQALSAAPAWAVPAGEDLASWRAGLTARLSELLHLPADPPSPPELRLLGQEQRLGYTLERVAIQTAGDLAAPAYLLTPDPPVEVAPAVLCLGRAPAGKAALAGEVSPAGEEALGSLLCRQGLRVLIPDLPGCGERTDDTGLEAVLLARGDSRVGWEVREARLMLAWLAAQPETAPGQVGLVGLGEALLPALLAGCLTSVKAVALHGDLRGFAAELRESNCLQSEGASRWEALPPGLAAAAELCDLLALLAPRPLLAVAEAPSAAAALTLDRAKSAYEQQGCGPRCEPHAESAPFGPLAAEFLGVWLSAGVEV